MGVQGHRVFINAKPQQVWDAITNPEFNDKYAYGCVSEYDLRVGGAFRALANKEISNTAPPRSPSTARSSNATPPRRLVQTAGTIWFSPEIAAEPATTLTWELEEQYGSTRLTVTHETPDAPLTAAMTSGDIADAGGGCAGRTCSATSRPSWRPGAPMGG
ncbi:SRPBCC domain-containing protein [Kutzneria kofuensis]|uniref:SRPBCC domain-containing protein n=1 Tax=Kutzneria kofuensis TaxID=103725 RepID=UPI0031E51338